MAHILVVDDSPVSLREISTILSKDGHTVVMAAGSEEGLMLATQDDTIELVVTDFNMLPMNGLDMLAKIRELPGRAAIPVAVVSTESTADFRERGRELGVILWALKPLNQESFSDAIRKVIEKAQVASASET